MITDKERFQFVGLEKEQIREIVNNMSTKDKELLKADAVYAYQYLLNVKSINIIPIRAACEETCRLVLYEAFDMIRGEVVSNEFYYANAVFSYMHNNNITFKEVEDWYKNWRV